MLRQQQSSIAYPDRASATSSQDSAYSFNHLRWLAAYMGAPIQLAVSDRPAKQAAHEGLPPEQRAASDPEVHIRLDYLLAQLPTTDPTRILVAVIQLLWMSVLRFQHMQRSIPLKLTAHFLYCVCWKGKGKPGYRWACPRHGPTGADVGGCIWDNWTELAKSAHTPPLSWSTVQQQRSLIPGTFPRSQPGSAKQQYRYEGCRYFLVLLTAQEHADSR